MSCPAGNYDHRLDTITDFLETDKYFLIQTRVTDEVKCFSEIRKDRSSKLGTDSCRKSESDQSCTVGMALRESRFKRMKQTVEISDLVRRL